MTLPRDYTRCIGESPVCPERERCARYRDIGEATDYSWARNLNPDNLWDCPQFIRHRP